jgi:hypothetical protein
VDKVKALFLAGLPSSHTSHNHHPLLRLEN